MTVTMNLKQDQGRIARWITAHPDVTYRTEAGPRGTIVFYFDHDGDI